MTRARTIADTPARNATFQPGTIAYFAMDTAPAGWLECDGSDVSRATYADLFAAIGDEFGVGDGSTTFGLPDLRGEFIRGWDHGRNVDTGRVFGSAQADAMQGHWHLLGDSSGNSGNTFGTTTGGSSSSPGVATPTDKRTIQRATDPSADGTHGTPRTAAETRPRSVALLACIKT
jgi:microcystin-dependent protein